MVDVATALGAFFGLYFGIPALLLLVYLLRRIRIVEQGTAMIIERWGKFHRRCDPGLHFLVPFMDKPRQVTWRELELEETKTMQYDVMSRRRVRKPNAHYQETKLERIDLRENVMDFEPQPIITRDNVQLEVHPLLLYRLIDPVRVAYETFDLAHAVEKLVQTTLRSILGDIGLDDTLASREEIQRGLESRIKNICRDWGIEILSVEILEITPTDSVQQAMHKQIEAERIRRAAIVTAEGQREKKRLEAEGSQQASITSASGQYKVSVLRAEGTAEARRTISRAEAEAVNIVAESLKEFGVNPTQYMVATKYVETFEKIGTQCSKRVVYFPYESDVVGALGAVSH